MDTMGLLDELQNKARRDAALREALLLTREEKNPVDAFCRKCQELGYPIYVMDLIRGVLRDDAPEHQRRRRKFPQAVGRRRFL